MSASVPDNDILIDVIFQGPRCANYDPRRYGRADACDPHVGGVSLGPRGGKRDAARVLRDAGWRFTGGKWFCPRCAARWR